MDNIDEALIKVAKHCVPENVNLELLFKSNNVRQTLFIQIFDNQIYLFNGLKGEYRHKQLLEQLFEVSKLFKLPNCVLKYNSSDHVIDWMVGLDVPIFSHSKLVNDPITNKIMAPAFSDKSYTSGKNIIQGYVPYDEEIKRILDESNKWSWEDKESTMIFKGHVGSYPHRIKIISDLNNKYKPVEFLTYIRNSPLDKKGIFQHPFHYLCRFRYQLLMNGFGTQIGNETFSIRSKYMLATGSICIYINLGVDHKEWWMDENIYDNFIIKCETVDEAINKITYFEENPEEAKKHLKKQNEFVKKYLNVETFNKYWYHLLNVYSERSSFKFEQPLQKDKLLMEEDIDKILEIEP